MVKFRKLRLTLMAAIRTMNLFPLLLAAPGAAVAGPTTLTSLDVVHLVFASLWSDRDDVRLASELKKLKLREQLSPQAIAYFRSLGLGPRSLASLEHLHAQTASLPPPVSPAVAIQPIPTDDEQQRIIQSAQQYAQSYTGKLPSFVCDQITKRYTNIPQTPSPMNARPSDHLSFSDSLKWTLRFVNGVEVGNLLNSSNAKLSQAALKPGQSLSKGEFGEDMLLILGPDLHPRFGWSHWEGSNGSRIAVFHYSVAVSDSRCTVSWASGTPHAKSKVETVRTAMNGLIFLDTTTGTISRLTIEASSIPAICPIKENRTIIDYGRVRIAGQGYTVPLAASVFVRADPQRSRNDISFVNYRRLDVQSILSFKDTKGISTPPSK